jgi:hypothetical protein
VVGLVVTVPVAVLVGALTVGVNVDVTVAVEVAELAAVLVLAALLLDPQAEIVRASSATAAVASNLIVLPVSHSMRMEQEHRRRTEAQQLADGWPAVTGS